MENMHCYHTSVSQTLSDEKGAIQRKLQERNVAGKRRDEKKRHQPPEDAVAHVKEKAFASQGVEKTPEVSQGSEMTGWKAPRGRCWLGWITLSPIWKKGFGVTSSDVIILVDLVDLVRRYFFRPETIVSVLLACLYISMNCFSLILHWSKAKSICSRPVFLLHLVFLRGWDFQWKYWKYLR